MPTLAQDLVFVRAGLDTLEAYLLSDELYWPLSGPASLSRLTIGGLLLAVKRSSVRSTSPADAAGLSDLESRLDRARLKWRSAWENKCRREMHARLGLWQNYLVDYRQSPGIQLESYPQQIQWRVILHLLSVEFRVPPKEVEILPELDKMVKSFWLPGDFVWELDLAPAFQASEFWFLYGKMKS